MIWLYLRLFVITGGAFALVDFVSSSVLAPGTGALVSAAKGLSFGLIMSGLLGTVHIFKARGLAGESFEGDIYATRQVRAVQTALSPERAFTLMSHYLGEVRAFRITELSQEAGVILARAPWSIRTFGCRVQVSVVKQESGTAQVTILSRPSMPLTLVDYGENLKIVTEAAAFLRGSDHA